MTTLQVRIPKTAHVIVCEHFKISESLVLKFLNTTTTASSSLDPIHAVHNRSCFGISGDFLNHKMAKGLFLNVMNAQSTVI